MGVDIYLLNRGRVILEIGGVPKKVGTLRRLCKITELNQWRANEMNACHEAVQGKRAPVAVLAWPAGVHPLDASNKRIDARVVLAWESNRSAANDMNADCLPILGYALLDHNSGRYVLHELLRGVAVPFNLGRAKEKGFLDKQGNFVRKSPPFIVKCQAIDVQRNLQLAVAKCALDDGRVHDVWTKIDKDFDLETDWYVGKKLSEVQFFRGA